MPIKKSNTPTIDHDLKESLGAIESGAELDLKTELAKKSGANQKTIKPKEVGGPKGLEPTRYGDWEAKGRCYDF